MIYPIPPGILNIILSIIEFCDEEEIPALIMSVEYEKAFDCLEWSFIDEALKYFNFGPILRNWVKVCYTESPGSVLIMVLFKVTCGVRQGDLLSLYLFVLDAEILFIYIRNNPNKEGIQINNSVSKISQYVDHTALSLLYYYIVILSFEFFEAGREE